MNTNRCPFQIQKKYFFVRFQRVILPYFTIRHIINLFQCLVLFLDGFFIYYFHESTDSGIYFAIRAASNLKWVAHEGIHTRRHSPVTFTVS